VHANVCICEYVCIKCVNMRMCEYGNVRAHKKMCMRMCVHGNMCI
jgi:hypothetical protein